MVQLTADLVRTYRCLGKSWGYKLAASTVIYMGAACNVASNRAAQSDGDVAKPFGGFSERGADNTGGADGEVYVQLYEEGEVLLDVTGVVVGTLLGAEVFCDDSNLFTLTPAAGVACRVGTIREYVADGKAWVHFQSAAIAGNKNRAA